MKRLMTGAAIGVLMACALPVEAQEVAPTSAPATEDTTTIVVQGFRDSLAKARNLKRKSEIIKDVIVAEDMAKFPELNLAESLQRLPGVAINREAGEGRRITLRGLGPDFTRVQLNGMEVLGNVDSAQDSRGQRSRDRAFDFNLFASELFSRVEVEKSYSASQNEGGMAGTVGLFTGKPFDYKPGMKGAISLKAGTNSYTNDFQPRLAAMYGYNWDNKFGVLFSLAYSKRKTTEQGYNVYSPNIYTPQKMQDTYLSKGLDISHLSAADQAAFKATTLSFQSGNRLSDWSADQMRIGATLALQWRPIETMTLTLDALKGKFDMKRSEIHLATRAHNDEIIINEDYVENGKHFLPSVINAIKWDKTGLVTYADVDNVTFGTENRRERNINNFDQIVLTGDWAVSDRLHLDGHVGMEKSTYDIPLDDKLYLEAQGGLIASYSADGTSASNVYKWDTTDPSQYTIRNLNFRQSNQSSRFNDAIGNLAFKLNEGATLKAGLAYRKYKTFGTEYYNDGLYQTFFKQSPGYDKVDSYYSVFTGFRGQSWIIGDWDKMLAHYNLKHTMTTENGTETTDIENTFGVEETTSAGYLQLDWASQVFGKPVRGNIGVRPYKTDILSSGLVYNASGNLTETSVKAHYSGALPAFNATVEVTNNFLLRLAADKNINRPNLQSLSMTGSVSLDNGKYYVNNGNPYLKPYTSYDYDVAAEWYFGKIGMITAGVFHKDIDNLITGETLKNVPYSVTGMSTALASGLTPTTIVSEYSRPINLDKARLNGLELAAQSDFVFLPAPFNHLGAVANLTLIDSNTKINGLDGPITGLSRTNANLTVYYETKVWGVRASANHRSKYLDNRYDGSDPTSEDGFDGTTYVDAAAFYNLSKRLRLTLDAINLKNQKEVQYNSIYHRLHNETQSGSTYLLGLDLTF